MTPPLPPPPPPPPPPNPNGVSHTFNYGYGYNYPMQSQRRFLVPGQAPSQLDQSVPSTCPPATEKEPPPAKAKSPSWFCDPCDLEFESEKALRSHRKSHVKCSDCAFEGAPKVVKGHYQASHGRFSGSGFKTVTVSVPGCRVQRFKICVGNRPEDIKQWITERKKRFPRHRKVEDSSSPSEAKEGKEKEGDGISMLLAGYGSSGSEDEVEGASNETKTKTTTGANSSNPSLVDTKKEKNYPTEAGQSQAGRRPRLCRYFARNGKCLNGDNCRFSHENPGSSLPSRRGQKRKRGGRDSSDTLLRKLLSNDMERESTMAMKMLQFLVQSGMVDS